MILLNEIIIKDFLSHENTKIDFKENQKLLIDGRSGSGKSSITEAILWVLFGKGRSDNRSLVRRGAKSASVSIRFRGDGIDKYNITRTTTTAGKNTLSVTRNTGSNGQFLPIEKLGIKDLQNFIEKDFLRSSYELFTNSVAYPQENGNSFIKSNANRRKDLLLEIIHANHFDELYDKTRAILNKKETEIKVAENTINFLENNIKKCQEVADKYDFYKKEGEDNLKEIESYDVIQKELERQLNGISQISTQIKDKKTIEAWILSSISKIDKQLESDALIIDRYSRLDIEEARRGIEERILLQKKEKEIEKEIQENNIAQMKINSHLANKPNVSDYTKDIENINNRLIPLIKDSSKCPAGENCPFVIPIKGQIEFLTEQITEKNNKSITEKKAIEEWGIIYADLVPLTRDTKEMYSDLVVLRSKIDSFANKEKIITEYEIFQKTTLPDIKNREIKSKEEKDKLNSDLSVALMEIFNLQEKFEVFDSNKINKDLSDIIISSHLAKERRDKAVLGTSLARKAQEDIKNSSMELVVINTSILRDREEMESLELLKEAFSPRGIKAVVVDYLVPTLEERINDILSQMSDFRIRLDTQAPKADEGMKEGLFIIVRNPEGVELPLENLSGGETVKVSIAISESLASLQNQIGFRIMDENVISLDKESTEVFVEVLTKLQDKFSQLLIISHLSEVKDIFYDKIKVVKTNGISQIVKKNA